MALIQCGECNKQISDKAVTCPNCGAPIAPLADQAGVVTTQQTAKFYKALQLIGGLLIVAGVVACSGGAAVEAAVMQIVGLIVYLGSRIGAWWAHG